MNWRVGKAQSRKIMKEPIVFFRSSQGKVSAVRDICPHRGIPLSLWSCCERCDRVSLSRLEV